MTNSDVRVATGDAERDDAFGVRKAVFVDEQGVDEELEWDEHDDPDAEAVHFVAVLESARGEGWGRRLMEALEAEARERGFDSLLLHGQTTAEGFYRGLGYETKSDEFDEAGIPHVEMRKSL